jgi:hypothetical protein
MLVAVAEAKRIQLVVSVEWEQRRTPVELVVPSTAVDS